LTLVRIAKDWDWPDLLRQTPGHNGVWDGIRFTIEEVEECDFLVVLNNRMKNDVRARCPEGRVWALMQEPYAWGFTDWMVEGHEAFDRVYTNYAPVSGGKYRISQAFAAWHVMRSFDELVSCVVPVKEKPLSWIVGNCRDLPGHMRSFSFLRFLRSDGSLPIDLFGRAVRPIEDKWDGLAPYRYSVAVENTIWPDYWPEKVADCFLAWTVPLYHGCPNLEKYFPADSFIRVDIDRPRDALAAIRRIIREDDWERRLPALEEARRRVLFDYQLFPHLAKLVQAEPPGPGEKILRTVPAYRRSFRTKIRRSLYKIKKHYLRLVLR
jgi:hypothetical protein